MCNSKSYALQWGGVRIHIIELLDFKIHIWNQTILLAWNFLSFFLQNHFLIQTFMQKQGCISQFLLIPPSDSENKVSFHVLSCPFHVSMSRSKE